MRIEISDIEYCRVSVDYEADENQVEEKREEVINFFKKSPVPGFRPGKATAAAIKLHFKNKIEEVLKNELAQNAFHLTVAEKNIRPFGQPQFTDLSLEGNKFSCKFCCNKLPDIELNEYKGFDIPKGHIPNAVEMSEQILQELRVRNGVQIPFEDNDFLQDGDSAIINYEGWLLNQVNSTMKKDGELMVIGKCPILGFDENLLGMRVGEKREFNLTMPKEGISDRVAGKEMKFAVELSMGSKSNPCPLDDELAHKVGAKDLQELVSLAQGMAGNRVQDLEKNYLASQVSSRLVENHDFEVPSWLASFEAEMLGRQYGVNWNDAPEDQRKQFLDAAIKNVKLSLILNKIRENEPEAQLADEEIVSILKQSVSKYKYSLKGMENKSDEEVFQHIQEIGYMPVLISTIKNDNVIDFIVKNSNIVE